MNNHEALIELSDLCLEAKLGRAKPSMAPMDQA